MFTLGNLICGFFAIVVAAPRRAADVDRDSRGARTSRFSIRREAMRQLDPTDDTHN